MRSVNLALSGVLEVVLWPFRSLHPIAGLAVVALLTSIAILYVIRATSNQLALASVKRRMQAALFEIRLFNDDLGTMLGATRRMLRENVTYLRLALAPVVWLTVPLLLLLTHLQFYYGYDGLATHASTVVKVRLDRSIEKRSPGPPAISLKVPPGLRVDTPFVWMPADREAAWRVTAERPGRYQLLITVDGTTAEKLLWVSDEVGWRSPARVQRGVFNELVAPVERPLDGNTEISSIHVAYDDRRLNILGLRTHWMVPFFAISGAWILGLRKRFGVVL